MPEPPGRIDAHRSEEVEQGYLAVSPDAEVRLRRIGEARLLTVKRGSGTERLEEEIEITESQFAALWPLTEGQRLTKRRFYVPVGEWVAEVDVFAGELDGLVTAEVEFESRAEGESFEPPEWFGTEITGDPSFANQTLAGASEIPETPR